MRLLTPEEFDRHQMKVSGARKVKLIASDTPVRPKKARKSRAKVACPTEHQEQCAVINWFDSYAPTKGLDPRLLFSIPNGSHKSPAAAMKFKREGLRSGVPDLALLVPTPTTMTHADVYGLMIEMKRIRGSTTSPEQLEMKALFEAQGYRCVIARGASEAIKAIEEYLS